MKHVVIGSDHAGFLLKGQLAAWLKSKGMAVHDVGTDAEVSCDYPDYAHLAAGMMAQGEADVGVLICGSGIGISIAANRHPHLRAALVRTAEEAKLARQHNNANVLVLGARFTDEAMAIQCLEVFLATSFEGGRHQTRVEKITPRHAKD